MVLEEEYDEAKFDVAGWTAALVIALIPASGFGACVVAGWAWAVVPTVTSLLACGFCYRGMRACERTIRVYREQQRLLVVERAMAEEDERAAAPERVYRMGNRR